MSEKAKSGKFGVLFNLTKGTKIVGDAATPLADNSWFRNSAFASTGSTLPYSTTGIDRFFKSPDSANSITPAVGDEVYPITLTKVCTVDVSVATEKGVIDTTDKCSDGYNTSIVDGFTGISGSFGAYVKFDEDDGTMNTDQRLILNRFFDIQTDDGEGAYTLVAKNDDDFLLAILRNEDQAGTVGNTQLWDLIPVILTGMSGDAPLKGVQNMDISWTKGEGPATRYERVTNSEESVF